MPRENTVRARRFACACAAGLAAPASVEGARGQRGAARGRGRASELRDRRDEPSAGTQNREQRGKRRKLLESVTSELNDMH